MKTLPRQFALPILLFAIFALLLLFADRTGHQSASEGSMTLLPTLLSIGFWFSAALLGNRVIDVFFWGRLASAATGTPTPRLIRQLSSLLIYLLGFMGIIGFVFEKPVTGLLATSGAIGIVLGFAIRSLILDLFSGVALNVERPFNVGEFINVQIRGIPPITGRVEEVNWRTTRILNDENSLQIIPNSLLGASTLTNYSRPEPMSEFELMIVLDFSVEQDRVLSILSAALFSAVADGEILEKPAPKTRIRAIDAEGVHYKLKYFIDPRQGGPGKKRHAVLAKVLRHLRQAGLEPAYPKQDMLTAPRPNQLDNLEAHRRDVLRRVVLFRDFASDDIAALAQRATPRHIVAGQAVVREGDGQDASMFVIVEGVLDVFVHAGDGDTDMNVRLLQPGDFFGEMSLLTGAPRSATVIARTDSLILQITKDDLWPLLEKTPEIVELISQIISQRQSQNQGLLEGSAEEDNAPKQIQTLQIMGRIRQFFGMS